MEERKRSSIRVKLRKKVFSVNVKEREKDTKEHLFMILTGAVSSSVYNYYFKAFGGWFALAMVLAVYSCAQIGDVSINMWLREWAHSYRKTDHGILIPGETENTVYYLKIYCVLIVITMFFVACM